MKELRAELAAIGDEHQTRRARREHELTVALVGYTNAGKSSLMRAMTGIDVLVADKHPLGVSGELRKAVKACRRAGGRVALGLRDILDDPRKVRAEWKCGGVVKAIEKRVDAVLVYGDPRVYDTLEVYRLPKAVRARSRYTCITTPTRPKASLRRSTSHARNSRPDSTLSVSDHDSTASHLPLQAIAERRGVPFVASIELTSSWAHFNAWPLRVGEKLRIDTGTADVNEVFAEARRLGATVIQANHPFISYGYLTSVADGVAPGGFNPRFELLEMNVCCREHDDQVLRQSWRLWNQGHRYYLSGGSDTHDVWLQESGQLRTYAHTAGALTQRRA